MKEFESITILWEWKSFELIMHEKKVNTLPTKILEKIYFREKVNLSHKYVKKIHLVIK